MEKSNIVSSGGDDVGKRVEELELSLPRENGFLSPHLYLYNNNLWVPSSFLHGVVSCQAHFQARDTDILVVSKPKSGTTWLKSLTFALANRDIWAPTDPAHPLLSHNPHSLVPWLENHTHEPANLPELVSADRPRLLATHLPYGSLPGSVPTSGARMVYICRNILDTTVSFWLFSRRVREKKGITDSLCLEDYVDSVCKGVEDFGPHWDHVLGYWRQNNNNDKNVLFLKYEELKADPMSGIKKVAEFMGCPLTPEEDEAGITSQIARLCSFQNLKELEVNKNGETPMVKHDIYFRKGKVGDWENHLPVSLARRLDEVMASKFHGSGLTFDTTGL